MNTIWKKLRGEKTGVLELHLKSGAIKYFVSKYRSWALRRAKSWLKKLEDSK